MRQLGAIFLGFVVLLLGWTAPGLSQTLVIGGLGEPVSLDSAIVGDGISQNITSQIYDGLVMYKGSTTEVAPALAEKWDVSADGRVWTLYLRKGVKFHDGEPFDSAAVVWNFERWWKAKHPQHENQIKAGQTFLYWQEQFDDFDDKSIVSDVKATDPYSVKVTLKQPQAPFLANLAIFAFGIASPKAVEKWGVDFGKHPIGTGAYRFVDWKANQEVVLDANPDYWGPKAKMKRVVVRNIKDNSARLLALKAGEVHIIAGLNVEDVQVVKSDPSLYLMQRQANATGWLSFNYHVKEFKDRRVRQAIAHAINKKAMVDAFYGGLGLVASQIQPPALWGYNKDLKDYEYSPAKAQELLKQAGFPSGLSEINWEDGKKEPLVFWYTPRSRPYFPNPKEIGEAIAADLAKAGIKAQLQTVEWANYLDKGRRGE